MIGQGLDASRDYLEVCKYAGFPQAGAWVLGTMGGILAGRYGLGPLLHGPMDTILPESIADDEMRERVGNVTGAFIGGNLGGTLGYGLSGQRKLDLSPTGIMRGAAGMNPEGAYEHPEEIPTLKELRQKRASAWPLVGWMVPTGVGLAAGAYLGGHAAPWIQGVLPEGAPLETAHDMGNIAGGVLGAEAGSMAGRLVASRIRDAERPLGAGIDNPNIPVLKTAEAPGFFATVPSFAKWLLPSMGGILAGATIGDAMAPGLAHFTPEGTMDAGAHVGRMAGGLIGGALGSGLSYRLSQPAEAPDVSPVGVTSVAAGVPVDPTKLKADLLAGKLAAGPDDADYIVSPNEHAAMAAFRDAGDRWGSGTDPRQALHEYTQYGSAATRIRIGPVGVRHFSRMFSWLPGNPAWDDSMDRHYDEFQRGPMSGHLIRLHEFENEFKWKHKEGDHASLENILSGAQKHGMDATPEQLLESTKQYLPKEWNAHPGAQSAYAAGYRKMLDDVRPHLGDGTNLEVKPDFAARTRRAAEDLSMQAFGRQLNALTPAEQDQLHNAFNGYLKAHNPRLYAEKQIADFFVGLDVPRSGNTYALVAKPLSAVGDMFGRTPADHLEQRPIKPLLPNASSLMSPEGAALGVGAAGLGVGAGLLAHTLMGGGGDVPAAAAPVA